MSRSIGRLKAVDVVGREMVIELRKNYLFNDLGNKGKIKDRAIVLRFVLFLKVWQGQF